MELLQMSKKELSRVEVMERMKTKKMTQKKGAAALGISVSRGRRLEHLCKRSNKNAMRIKAHGVLILWKKIFFIARSTCNLI